MQQLFKEGDLVKAKPLWLTSEQIYCVIYVYDNYMKLQHALGTDAFYTPIPPNTPIVKLETL